MASVLGSYGVTVEWGTLDVTGVALAGSGNEYGTVNGVPCGALVEIGTFTNAPVVGSSSLSNFSVFASGHVGDGYGCGYGGDGFWADESVAPVAGFAGTQIYVVVVNTSTVAAASQVGIFYVSDAVNPNWRFPISDAADISIDLEDLLNDPGTPSASLTSGAQIVYGSGPVYDAVDSLSFFQLQQTNSATQVATNSWSSSTNGKWEVATNWSSSNAPTVGDTVDLITNANTKTVTINAATVLSNAINACLTINNLYIAGTANSTNTLFLNNAGTSTPLQVLGTALTLDTNGAMVVNNSAVVATNESAGLTVGNAGGNASLTVTNGGTVYSGNGTVGNQTPSSNNTVLVAGPGSLWSNGDGLTVGASGARNSLVISNGGAVYALFSALGYYNGNNTAVVTGSGSVWSNSGTVTVGYNGAGNSLVIANAGVVVDELGYMGAISSSSNNAVLVTGPGSLWSNSVVEVGDLGAGNNLVISNGGVVYDTDGSLGYDAGSNNTGLVTDTGSVWSNQGFFAVGDSGAGNSLVISNGGAVYAYTESALGFGAGSSNNIAVITGTGSVWYSQTYLDVGRSGSSNLLTIAGGSVVASNVTVGFANSASNNILTVSGGSLSVTNALGNAALVVSQAGGMGSLILDAGSVTVNSLVATNGANSVLTFNGGTLISGGTFVTNNQMFFLGFGIHPSTFQLDGGVHNFANNMEIRTKSFLTGCGTINGNVTVDPGGTVLANCGGNMNFTGAVTNYGDVNATNGTALNFYGLVVNNGVIDATNGSAQFYGGIVNNGTILTNTIPPPVTNSWIDGSGEWQTATNWSLGMAPSLSDSADYITNAASKTVTIDATTTNTPGTMTISNLYIAGTANSTNTLFLNNAGTNMPLQILNIALTLDTNGALVVNSSAVVVTNGSAQLTVGNTGGNASLTITNGGAVYSGSGNVGSGSFSDNNTVLVSGVGSVWSNSATLSVGADGVGNSLIITNGGAAYSASGTVGSGSSSGNNTVLVAGPGSVWSNSGTVSVGADGMGNNLVVSNGGAVVDENGYLGNTGSFSTDNTVLVSGVGSVWSNTGTVSVGQHGPANQMIIGNGGAVYDSTAYVGHNSSSRNNTVLVTGTNSVWSTSTILDVGDDDGGGDQLIISNGAAVVASNVTVGVASLSSNAVLITSGGGLFLNGQLSVSLGSLILSNGTVTVNRLVLANGSNSVLTFDAGLLDSGGTSVSNNQVFAVGDGADAATFQLNGGVHKFANGLEISTNAALTGCGTINGNVVVDPGGAVLANCGGNLNFTGIVTNNAAITASDGTGLNFYGLVVNNGVIDATGGSVHFLSTLNGTGSVLLPPTNSWIDGSGKWETATNWSRPTAPSLADSADVIANAGNNIVTIDATTSSNFPSTLTISNLIVAAPLNMTNTLFLNNAGTNIPLAVSGSVSVDTGGSMILTNSALQVGGASGGALSVDGQLTMDSGTILVYSNLLVGPSNPLSLVTIWGGGLYVTNAAHNAVSEVRYGTLVLTGGVYFTDSLLITNTGASFLNDGGTFTITGLAQVDQGTQTVASGTTQLSSNLVVGTSANSTGTVNVTGGQLIVTNAPITIGSLGVGSMTVSNGAVATTGVNLGAGTNSQGTLTLQEDSTVTVSSNLTAGSASGATGTVTITGGQLVATNGVIGVGNDGTTTNGFGVGSVTVSNGTVLANQILLGSSAGGQGQLTVQAGGLVSLVGTGALVVANDLTIDGGSLEIGNGQIYCGYQHPGAMNLNGGAAACQIVYVGYNAQGTLTVSAGQMTLSSLLDIGGMSGSTGNVWISGGQLTATALTTAIGDQGVGQMSISNGIVTMADVKVAANTSNPGTLTLAGGTLTVNTLSLLNPGSQFNFTGGWLNTLGITNSNGQMLTLGNGVTPIALNLLGGTSLLGNGLQIAINATVSGFGTINGNLVNYGLLSPGSGTLSFLGAVTNYATILTTAGGTIDFHGPVVNYGLILTNSAVHFLGGVAGNGLLLDPAADADGTGQNNLFKCVAGLDPTNPASVFVLQVAAANQPPQKNLLFNPVVPGRTYTPQYTTDLVNGVWSSLATYTVLGTNGNQVIITDTSPFSPQEFYRIEISLP